MSRPRILSISLSPIRRDARVLRQLDVLAEHGDVTTVGFGGRPDAAMEHVEINEHLKTLPQTPAGVALLAARQWHRAEMAAPAVKQMVDKLRGRTFDLVVANEARILPAAVEVAAGAPIWADMHEWAPEERSHVTSWRMLVGPLMDHMCVEYLPQVAAVTSVSSSIADKYTERYGVPCEVVRNARPYVELEPQPLREDGVLRLVHSGGAVPGRNIEALIDACLAVENTTLDLILVPANDGGKFLDQLKAKAEGSDRVRFHPAVTPAELPARLNSHDVGIYCLPPANLNMELALPNKLFDFVQARLAFAVSPNPDMARFVREHDLGVVSADYSTEAFIEALRTLTPENVWAAKQAAHAQARELSSDTDVATMHDITARLLAR